MSLTLEFYPADDPYRVVRLATVVAILVNVPYGDEALKVIKTLKDHKGVLTVEWWESPNDDLKYAVEQTWEILHESTVEHRVPRRFVEKRWDK